MRTLLFIAATVLTGLAAMVGCDNGREGPPMANSRIDHLPPEAASSAEETKPLRVGDLVPSVELTDMEGHVLDLPSLVRTKPTVIIFYRGGWCPYCNTHLGELATIEPQLVELGYQVLAISADRPLKLHETHEKFGFEYRLLSDSKMEAARAFGIAFKVDTATFQKYQGYGIDLEEASGEAHHLLPVPSVFIAGTDGVITFGHSNPDYKVRLAPDEVLEAARRVAR